MERNPTCSIGIWHAFVEYDVSWLSNKCKLWLGHPFHVNYWLISLLQRVLLFVLWRAWLIVIFRRTVNPSLCLTITNHFKAFWLQGVISFRMRLHKNLTGSLTKIDNLWLSRMQIFFILCYLPMSSVFISQIIEAIKCFNGLFTSLLITKDKVDPIINISSDVFFFQTLSEIINE